MAVLQTSRLHGEKIATCGILKGKRKITFWQKSLKTFTIYASMLREELTSTLFIIIAQQWPAGDRKNASVSYWFLVFNDYVS